MKAAFKPTILIATTIVALSSYGTSAAQSAENTNIIRTAALTQPIATHPILKRSAKIAPRTTPEKIVSLKDDNIQPATQIHTDQSDLFISYPPAEERQAHRDNIEKYGAQFRGLRPSILSSNNSKIGSTTQYSRFDDNLHFDYQSSSKSRFTNDTNNLFIRAQINF